MTVLVYCTVRYRYIYLVHGQDLWHWIVLNIFHYIEATERPDYQVSWTEPAMANVIYAMLFSPAVWGYFALLIPSIGYSFKKASYSSIILSLVIMCVTWFYILRFTYAFIAEEKPGSLLDEAYVDVVRGAHWTMSSQLLTWVVVAVVWAHAADGCYVMFGMLGAMSAAYTRSAGPAGSTAQSLFTSLSHILLPLHISFHICFHILASFDTAHLFTRLPNFAFFHIFSASPPTSPPSPHHLPV
eukprot:g35381.t1